MNRCSLPALLNLNLFIYRNFNAPQRVVSLPRTETCPFTRVVANVCRSPLNEPSSGNFDAFVKLN